MLRESGFLVLATLVVGMAGCSGDPVKAMLEDPNAYAHQALTESRLPSSVLKDLHLQASTETVRKVRINYEMNVNDRGFGGRYDLNYSYNVRDNGLVQTFVDGRQNGITVLYEFNLEYGPFNLIEEEAYPSRHKAGDLTTVRDIRSMDGMLLHPAQNAKFNADIQFATLGEFFSNVSPLLVPIKRQFKCSSKDPIAAIKIHPKLTGEAIPYTCEIYIENSLMESRTAYYYLLDYGLRIPELIQNERGVRAYTVKTVELPEDPHQPSPINRSGSRL
jgi:hypothetical protein